MPATMTLLVGAPRKGRPAGPMLQAAILEAIEEVEPSLSQRLHDGGNPPVYHTALLPSERREQRLIHIGLADEDDYCRLLTAWMRRPPLQLWLNGEALPLARLDSASGVCSWDELTSQEPMRVRLHFRSPTLFRSPSLGSGGPRPIRVFPGPERILDSLARRWAAFAPIPISAEELANWVNETDLQGRVVRWKGPHPIRGFVGSISWSLTGRRQEIGALLGLGEHLGVGSRTTQGCGHLELEIQ